jgi:hypothetical protein
MRFDPSSSASKRSRTSPATLSASFYVDDACPPICTRGCSRAIPTSRTIAPTAKAIWDWQDAWGGGTEFYAPLDPERARAWGATDDPFEEFKTIGSTRSSAIGSRASCAAPAPITEFRR